MRKDGHVVWVQATGNIIRDAQGQPLRTVTVVQDITERKRAEEALREGEERFRLAVESSPAAKVMIDEDGRMVLVNSQTERLFGYTREELIGQPVEMLVPERFRSQHQQYRAGFARTPQMRAMGAGRDLFGLRKDGSEVPVEIGLNPIEAKGKTLVLSSIVDITERKQAEQKIRALNAELQEKVNELNTLIDIIPVGVWVGNRDCSEIRGNPVAYRIFGFPPGINASVTTEKPELPSGLKILVNGEEVPPEDSPMQKVARTGEPWHNFEHQIIFPDGTVKSIYGSVAPLFDDDGQVRQVIAAYADYTERKRGEEALRLSEAQLQTLFNEAPLGVYLVDGDFRIRQVNPTALPVFGDIPDLVGRDFDEVIHILWPKEYADEVVRIFRHTLETGEPYYTPERIEERLDRGVTEYYEWQVNRIPLPGGDYGVVCYFRDISAQVFARLEREKLLAAEREARAAADAASHAKDEFLATVSHELRTPLNAMLGWARLLSGGTLNDETAKRGLKAIEQNAKAQAQLIEDLLDVSRIISGKFRLNSEPVQLARVIEAAVDSVRPTAEAKGVRLQVTLDPDAGPVLGDAGRIQQVVWNLLSNAVKFTPKGGRVQVALIRVNSQIEIVVSDTGQGIAPEFLPHVFDRFRQADGSTTRKHAGLGLGLAIVRHITELHGGSVSADSPGKGKGASFTVRLPLMVIHTRPGDEGRTHPGVEGKVALSFQASPALEGVKVLVVDDDPESLFLLSTVLTECGAYVKTAASAEEGFREVQAWRPNVIVSDIGMPGEDGYEFMRRVKTWAREVGTWIPAVALTAYARAEDRMKALSSGYQMYVAKPVEPAELITVIASLIERPTTP